MKTLVRDIFWKMLKVGDLKRFLSLLSWKEKISYYPHKNPQNNWSFYRQIFKTGNKSNFSKVKDFLIENIKYDIVWKKLKIEDTRTN